MIGRIIEAIPPTNDEFYIEYPVSSNVFTLKREDRDDNSCCFKKQTQHFFKNSKNQNMLKTPCC